MLMRAKVDFFEVSVEQRVIDGRLENWARWNTGSCAQSVSPMFRLYRSTDARGDCNASGLVVDIVDAERIQAALVNLPTKVRLALSWHYLKRHESRHRACLQLNPTMEGFARYVITGRQLLIDRNV